MDQQTVKETVVKIEAQAQTIWSKYSLLIVAVCIASLTGAWILWKPKPKAPETYAPEVKQSDGSIVVERKPHPQHKAAHQIPKGAVVERAIDVTVKPFRNHSTATVNLSLVRNKDESRRVVASSTDGEIVGAIDIPVEDAKPLPKAKLWAVGGAYNPIKNVYGGWVDRDIGFVRLGVQVNQASDNKGGIETWVKAGIKF